MPVMYVDVDENQLEDAVVRLTPLVNELSIKVSGLLGFLEVPEEEGKDSERVYDHAVPIKRINHCLELLTTVNSRLDLLGGHLQKLLDKI